MVLELISGVDFRCVLHPFSSLVRFKVSWGQVWQENDPKPKIKSKFQFPNISPTQDRIGAKVHQRPQEMRDVRRGNVLHLQPINRFSRGRCTGFNVIWCAS